MPEPTSHLLDCLGVVTTEKTKNDCLAVCIAAAMDAMTASALSGKPDADIAAEARVLAAMARSMKAEIVPIAKPAAPTAVRITSPIAPPRK